MSAGAVATAPAIGDGGVEADALFATEGIFASGVLDGLADRGAHAGRLLGGDRSHRSALSRPARTVKRAFDLVGACLLLLLGAPVLLIVAAAIRLEGPGP